MLNSVSVIIPCHNEEKHIADCLLSILNSDYPTDKIEILVIDGRSTDGTRQIVMGYQKQSSNIKLIDNEKVHTQYGLNLGIDCAENELVMIASAHSKFPSDYIQILVKQLIDLKTDVVGGVMETCIKNSDGVSEAIVQVLSSRIGVGGSMFRLGVDHPTLVDTVPFGLYRKKLLKEIGGYDLRLRRNHDIEMSKRILAKGGKIHLVPDVSCTYFARETFTGLAKNNFENGYWNILTVYITKRFRSLSLRHFIPLIFVLSLLLPLCVALFFFPVIWIALFSLGAYLSVVLYASSTMDKSKTNYVYLALAFFVLHFSYGFGSLFGLLRLDKLFQKQTS